MSSVNVDNTAILQAYISRTIAYLSTAGVFYFNFAPYLYIVDYAGSLKLYIFFVLISFISFLILLKMYLHGAGGALFGQHHTAIALYILFAMYVLLRFLIGGSGLDSIITARNLVVVNTLFMIFAIYSLDSKHEVINMVFFLSLIYYLYLVYSYSTGAITIESIEFQNIFSGLEEYDDLSRVDYQAINTYLGLFIIICVHKLSNWSSMAKIGLLLASLSAFFGMFMVGGRSSILAVIIVVSVFMSNEIRVGTSRTTIIIGATIMSIILMVFGNILSETVAFTRFSILSEAGDASSRIGLFSNAIDLFLRDAGTVIWGAGIDSFPVFTKTYNAGLYPHNIALELLSEYGIIGLCMFFAPVVYILNVCHKRFGATFGENSEARVLVGITLYYFILASGTGSLGSSWGLLFFIFMMLPSDNNIPGSAENG